MDDKTVTSFSTTSERPRPKVDMKHGFLRSIILNQIERDEYHKMTIAMQEVDISPQECTKQQHQEPVTSPKDLEAEAKREAAGKRASRQLYTPPHARGEVKPSKKESPLQKESPSQKEAPSPEQTHASDQLTSTAKSKSTIVSELAAENSLMRQKARDKLLRERKTNGTNGGGDSPQLQETSTAPSTILNPDQPLFRLRITTNEQGQLEDCIVYEGDTPARVAKRIVQKLQLSEANSRKIRTEVEEAMLLYLAEKNK
uniref:Uncharacterized protein n=1 Tax=Plectus sambesii TaxID=2011161 RepID=A0A914XW07_9BILA